MGRKLKRRLIIPSSLSKCHIEWLTEPSLDDLGEVSRVFFDISEVDWFTDTSASGQRERSEQQCKPRVILPDWFSAIIPVLYSPVTPTYRILIRTAIG